MTKHKLLPAIALLVATLIGAQPTDAKKVLDHSSFDDWKLVRNYLMSRDGRWGAYSINPQQGDGILTFFNSRSGTQINIPRGAEPKFSADGNWAVASIKPLFADTRQAKIDKKKDFDMPQDSLAIINLQTGNIEKIPSVISYAIADEGGDWVAYLSCDTTYVSPKELKEKEAGKPLVLKHVPSGKTKLLKWVKEYVFDRKGTKLAVSQRHVPSDSLSTDGMAVINLPDTALILIDRDRKFYGKPVFSYQGDHLAFIVSNDTVKSGTKESSLLLADLNSVIAEPKEFNFREYPHGKVNLSRPHSSDPEQQELLMKRWSDNNRRQEAESLKLNQYSKPEFSHNGRRLIVGVAPSVAPNDTTIVDFEQPELDIWRWDAPLTPPQENKQVESLRKKTYPIVLDLATGSHKLLTSNPLVEVDAPNRWDSDWALLHDHTDHIVSHQWNYNAPEMLNIVNIVTGEIRQIGEVAKENAELSPDGKYVVWFEDRDYYVYDIASGERRKVSGEIDYPLWGEDEDRPLGPQPYGIAGWSDSDESLLIYDRYDIWRVDPKGIKLPENLTAGDGRKNSRRYRYLNTDSERRTLSNGDLMLLEIFDYSDKRNGLATMKYGKATRPELKVLDGYMFSQIRQAKNQPDFSFVKANFSTSPDVWVATGGNFVKSRRLSDANPQMKEYNWGTAQLVKWYAYDGKPSEGVLYVPEDLDPTKKYPMLCVFYETGSEELYRHYVMEPSWSWVNYPFYVSRGYVVFVPDIHYTSGVPGECAYNYVCSGAEELCKRYEWIDKDRIGIDGQSWGGYQTAYLVTRTNMFACAGSGAPVANMTSAFGGIRWGSGDSRQAQYEMGQSRIGRNLWEAPELYIANSPVFHADRVETPLLIMHNDADGAVPWYQGIEMFMALRRLGKPVWMLQYNGEAHNLRERKNRKDITVRLQQFFDHYLKGAPMPEWMKNGIPAIRKGQELGY